MIIPSKQALAPGPPGGPYTKPISKPRAYSYSGRKIGSGTCVGFDGTNSEVVAKMPQSEQKNDQFLAEYASRKMWPIYVY